MKIGNFEPSIAIFLFGAIFVCLGVPAILLLLFLIGPWLVFHLKFQVANVFFLGTIFIWLLLIAISEIFAGPILKRSLRLRLTLGLPYGENCSKCGAEIIELPYGMNKEGKPYICGACLKQMG